MFQVGQTVEEYKEHILNVLKNHGTRHDEPYAVQIDWGGVHFAFRKMLHGEIVPLPHIPLYDEKLFEQAVRSLETAHALVRYEMFDVEDRGSTLSYIVGLPEHREKFERPPIIPETIPNSVRFKRTFQKTPRH